MSKIDLPAGLYFRPMSFSDIDPVLALIEQIEEDEVEGARELYQEDLTGQFVFTHEGTIVGVTGATYAQRTDNSFWMSWTCMEENYVGGGLLDLMLQSLLAELKDWQARKVFANMSDFSEIEQREYHDELLQAYHAVGFLEELKHRDYYDRNIGLMTLGLKLKPGENQGMPEPISDPANPTDTGEIPETTGAFYIDWDFVQPGREKPELWRKKLDLLGQRGARSAFVGVTSDAQGVADQLSQLGFREAGRMVDFYADGIDDLHFRFDFR